ncbi:phage tail protein [Burkholderia cenocepacia]|uniref:glycine-rich domain-containing protein n=1 Tax=Burkholderia cenocepacia TaxID=95486 RepID=UPI0022308A72|nr:phage tail protein [Burkholderia cenocepacia]MCW3641764.1 phage tail protein [Burkholderia cenocepacia]
MATQNDFLAFAVGAGANVLTQSAYAVLSAIETGFQAGTAQSAACNKVWRQSSIMAAVVAAFIVERTGQPVIDDGTTETILANLLASSAAPTGDATKLFQVQTAPSGDSSNNAASTAFVQGFAGGRKAVFLSSTTWTVPTGVTQGWITGCAAGGGGGAGGGSTASSVGAGGGGGGYGQQVIRQLVSLVPGSVLTITIGSGGAGAAQAGGAGGNGTAGGNTTVAGLPSGTLTLAGGGFGFGGATTSTTGSGGGCNGGYPYGGWGSDVSSNVAGTAAGGEGASGPFGGGGGAGRGGSGGGKDAYPSFGYGSGGGGGGGSYATSSTSNGGAGTNGSPGFLMIEY